MLFVTASGISQRLNYGTLIRGYRLKGQRPKFVVVEKAEIDNFIPPEDFSFYEFVSALTNCLSLNGKVLFIKEPESNV